MASSSYRQYSRLYDPIRKAWVKETPEERVRQKLLQILVRDLHFPVNMLAVEKELSQLPHLQLFCDIPKRRIDILAFAKRGDDFWPLLMIECKAEKLNPQFANQLVGYNSFVQAPFLCLANEKEVVTGSYDDEAGHFRFEPGLKSYSRLLALAQSPSAVFN